MPRPTYEPDDHKNPELDDVADRDLDLDVGEDAEVQRMPSRAERPEADEADLADDDMIELDDDDLADMEGPDA